jgi:hypothetical protein
MTFRGLVESGHASESRRCAACGGRNQPGTTVCGFCARPLAATTAVHTAGHDQPSSMIWLLLILLGLAMVTVLLFNLAAAHIAK